MPEKPIRILLADDHQVLRDGLRTLIGSEDDMTIVGEASTGSEAVRLSQHLQPDIIILDLGMPDISGLEVIRRLKAQASHVGIVVLSMHLGRRVVRQAIEAGCDGYVPKSSAHTSLLEAIRAVNNGQRFLDPKAANALMESINTESSALEVTETLTEREREVLRLTAMGFASREIGDQLALSPKTVETYRQRIMEKLGLSHRSELVRAALQAGLLDDLRKS